jgi:1-deoxy-D-xylulose-5-phosphate reductoisomerase
MEVPIRYSLTYPKREKSNISMFDFRKNSKLEFFPVEFDKFKCLSLAYEALRAGKSMPCYMNGVNEVLVHRFLKKEISWSDIPIKLEKLMSSHKVENVLDLNAILEIDRRAKIEAKTI